MELHHLPTELLGAVLREAIREIGLRKSVQLRLVCKRFDSLTLDAIYSLPTFEQVDNNGPRHLRRDPFMGRKMLTELILFKLRQGNADERALCVAIQTTVSYMKDDLEVEEDATSWSDYVTALATAAAQSMYFEDLIYHLLLSNTPHEAVGHVVTNALIAATLTNQSSLLSRLIAEGASVDERTRCFGDALSAATRFSSDATFDLLFKHARKMKNTINTQYGLDLLEAAAVAGREGIVRQLLVSHEVTLEADPRYDKIILNAAKANKLKVTNILLQHREPLSRELNEEYFWSSLATISSQQGHELMLRKILGAELMPQHDRNMGDCMIEAARNGQIQIVHLLLPYCNEDLIRVRPEILYWAARRGEPDLFYTLLDKVKHGDISTVTEALAGAVYSTRRDFVFQLIDKVRTWPLKDIPWDILDGRSLDLFRTAVELML